MKKKLLVLLIAVIPTLMPNLASAIEIEWESLVISYRVPLPPFGDWSCGPEVDDWGLSSLGESDNGGFC